MTDRLECVWVKQNDKRHLYVDDAYIVMAYLTWWDKKTSIPDTWAVTVRNPVFSGFTRMTNTDTLFSGFTRMTNTDTLDDAKNVAQLICASTLHTSSRT